MEIYVTLQLLGIHDPMISIGNMGQIPIKTLVKLCQKSEELYKHFLNKQSESQANTAYLVYNFGVGLSGGKAERKIKAKNFLPFPDAVIDQHLYEISKEAKQIMLKVLKAKLLTHKQTTMVSQLVN